jgi:hypothetical protein
MMDADDRRAMRGRGEYGAAAGAGLEKLGEAYQALGPRIRWPSWKWFLWWLLVAWFVMLAAEWLIR